MITQAELKSRLCEAKRMYNIYIAKADTAEIYRRQLTCGHSGEDTGVHAANREPDEGFIRLCAYYEAAETAKREWIAARDRVQMLCSRAEPAQREVLIYRYLNDYRFEDIAKRLNYANSYVFELHRKALKYLCSIL